MAAQYCEFRELNTEVLGISTDTVWSHKIFAETSPSASTVQYPLVADPSQQIAACYGALNPETGLATRTTLLISPDGLIKYFCKYPGPVGRNVEELLRVIEALQFVERTGKGAPAGWQPGDPGIERSWELVGKI